MGELLDRNALDVIVRDRDFQVSLIRRREGAVAGTIATKGRIPAELYPAENVAIDEHYTLWIFIYPHAIALA